MRTQRVFFVLAGGRDAALVWQSSLSLSGSRVVTGYLVPVTPDSSQLPAQKLRANRRFSQWDTMIWLCHVIRPYCMATGLFRKRTALKVCLNWAGLEFRHESWCFRVCRGTGSRTICQVPPSASPRPAGQSLTHSGCHRGTGKENWILTRKPGPRQVSCQRLGSWARVTVTRHAGFRYRARANGSISCSLAQAAPGWARPRKPEPVGLKGPQAGLGWQDAVDLWLFTFVPAAPLSPPQFRSGRRRS